MSALQQIAQQQPELTLERFVEVVNEFLPQFRPEQSAGSRGQESVNPRLVRHYTTQGLLDKPLKQGREARYTYRHLLQLLVLRRLLAEGYSVSSMSSLIGGQTNTALENILQGGAQLTVEAANPALAFLSHIRDRGAPPTSRRSGQNLEAARSSQLQSSLPEAPVSKVSPDGGAAVPQAWHRVELIEGLELHVRQDFALPTTAHERERLLELIAEYLNHLSSTRRMSP